MTEFYSFAAGTHVSVTLYFRQKEGLGAKWGGAGGHCSKIVNKLLSGKTEKIESKTN